MYLHKITKKDFTKFIFFQGFVIPKVKREGRQKRRKPTIPVPNKLSEIHPGWELNPRTSDSKTEALPPNQLGWLDYISSTLIFTRFLNQKFIVRNLGIAYH